MASAWTGQSTAAFSRRLWLIGLNAALMLATAFILLRTVRYLAWIAVAALFALALEPLVRRLTRWGLKRGLAVAAVVLLVLGVFALLFLRLVPLVLEQGRALVEAAPGMVQRLTSSELFQRADAHIRFSQRLADAAGSLGAGGGALMGVVAGVFTGLAAVVTVAVMTVFMLLFGPALVRDAMQWVEPARRQTAWAIAERVRKAIGGYVLGLMIIGLVGGTVTAVTLAILGVPYFLALGLLVALLSLLPFIGATIGISLSAIVALATSGWVAAVIVLGVMVVYNQVEGQL
ncbi:MAG: AI-2E family transporter, partial [Myxococcales bacterium]